MIFPSSDEQRQCVVPVRAFLPDTIVQWQLLGNMDKSCVVLAKESDSPCGSSVYMEAVEQFPSV